MCIEVVDTSSTEYSCIPKARAWGTSIVELRVSGHVLIVPCAVDQSIALFCRGFLSYTHVRFSAQWKSVAAVPRLEL